MRAVLDTNIIVSAYLGGALENVLKAFKTGIFTLVVSESIADEYLKVLRRPKLRIKPDEFDDFASLLLVKAEFVTPNEVVTAVKADPSDNKFLEAALEGEVDCLVNGDNHLLAVKHFRGIPIITAREFIKQMQGNS